MTYFRFGEWQSHRFRWMVALLICGWGCLEQSELVAQQSESTQVRFATLNSSMYRDGDSRLIKELRGGDAEQPRKIAAILQKIRPDVVLLNEFDFDESGEAADLFIREYLEVSQGGAKPIDYEFSFVAPVNTGVDSGADLDNDGKRTGTANDAFGFGRHSGQYGMLVLSKYPIEMDGVRTFQKFLWKDMPDSLWPIVPETQQPFYSEEAKQVFRLSSKSHWDLPIQVGQGTIHFLVSHPTPPVFDGSEDRNGCRNHDEIRFWADYISPGRSDYIYDDLGSEGGLARGAHFVIAGDLNADPHDGDHREAAACQLTEHDLIDNSFVPSSAGAKEAAELTAGKNAKHSGDPAHDTGDFNDQSVGNLRIDYVLPSKTLKVSDSGVFWPPVGAALRPLVEASDHRLVWVDILSPTSGE